jgi:ABC-2 type transport system permease protein
VGEPSSDAGRVLRAYWHLLGARVRSDWQYRTSFTLLTIAQATVTALDLAVILVIFELVPALGGWSVAEVLVLYGFTMLAFGLADMAISQVETVPRYVLEGTLDRLLLRPMPVLVQLSAAEFALRRIGRILPGLATLIVGLVAVDIAWSLDRILLVPLTVIAGTAIFGAVWVVTCSISFWLVGAREFANAFTYGGSFAHQYPMHVFSEWVRALIGWLLPLAFVAYVPTIHLVGADNPLGLPWWLASASPVVAVLFSGVAFAAWRTSIRNYQSTGS